MFSANRCLLLAFVVCGALVGHIVSEAPQDVGEYVTKRSKGELQDPKSLRDLEPAASDMLALATGYGHGKKSGKGHKGVKGHSGHKGFKGKKSGKKHEDHWSKHSNAKGKHSKGHHDSKKYHGSHSKGSKGHKGAKFGKKGHKHKGHVTKGFKNTYHKNEFSKKTKFYDSFDNGGYHKKFGGYKGHYGGSKGNKFKGGKLSGFFKGGKFGKKHHADKGKHFDQHKGSKGHFEEKGSYGHKSSHSKGGKGKGKGHGGYGHKHKHKHGGYGHDHGYGHSGHYPTYAYPYHVDRRQDEGEQNSKPRYDDAYQQRYGDYASNGQLNDKKYRGEEEHIPEYEERTEPIENSTVTQQNEREIEFYEKDEYPKQGYFSKEGGFYTNQFEQGVEMPTKKTSKSLGDNVDFFEEQNPTLPMQANQDSPGASIVTSAFDREWVKSPGDEVTQQVIGYFNDDRDDHTTSERFFAEPGFDMTSSRPNFYPIRRGHEVQLTPEPNLNPEYKLFGEFHHSNQFDS